MNGIMIKITLMFKDGPFIHKMATKIRKSSTTASRLHHYVEHNFHLSILTTNYFKTNLVSMFLLTLGCKF